MTRDSVAETGPAPPSATTAVAVVAQSAELAHGVACVVTSRARPDGWAAICCSQFAGVARWTWSHNSGRPTGNIWPLNSSVATSLTNESFMRASEYTTRGQWWCQRGAAVTQPRAARCGTLCASTDRPPACGRTWRKGESGVSIPGPLARRFHGAGMGPVPNPKPEGAEDDALHDAGDPEGVREGGGGLRPPGGARRQDDQVQRLPHEGRRAARARRAAPPRHGRPGALRRRQAQGDRRAVHRGQGGAGRPRRQLNRRTGAQRRRETDGDRRAVHRGQGSRRRLRGTRI